MFSFFIMYLCWNQPIKSDVYDVMNQSKLKGVSNMQLMIFKAGENARPSSRVSYYVMSGLLFIGVKAVVSFYT